VGTGYIPLERYLGANREGAEGMASGLAGRVQGDAQKAQGMFNQLTEQARRSSAPTLDAVNPDLYGKAQSAAGDAAAQARSLQSAGGIGAMLTDQYGKGGGYGSGMRGFDAFLAGSAGGDRFQQLGQQYGGLDAYLGAASGDYRPSAEGAPKMGGGASGLSPPQWKGTGTTEAASNDPEDDPYRWGNS
jgi:hypothetical protein